MNLISLSMFALLSVDSIGVDQINSESIMDIGQKSTIRYEVNYKMDFMVAYFDSAKIENNINLDYTVIRNEIHGKLEKLIQNNYSYKKPLRIEIQIDSLGKVVNLTDQADQKELKKEMISEINSWYFNKLKTCNVNIIANYNNELSIKEIKKYNQKPRNYPLLIVLCACLGVSIFFLAKSL